jgi:hypothetical protein
MLALLHAFLSGVARVIGRGSFGTVFSFFYFILILFLANYGVVVKKESGLQSRRFFPRGHMD